MLWNFGHCCEWGLFCIVFYGSPWHRNDTDCNTCKTTTAKMFKRRTQNFWYRQFLQKKNEPPHDKTKKMTVRPAKTRIRLGIRPVWSESSLCTQWVAKDQAFFVRTAKTLSDRAHAQADLSLRWAHKPLCWFCHEAQMYWRCRGRFSRQLVVVAKQSMLKRLHS